MPNPVPQESCVSVGFIFPPRDSVSPERVPDLFPPNGKHRPQNPKVSDDFVISHARKPFRSGAAYQPHQKGFCLVICVMRKHKRVSTVFGVSVPEGFISGFPCGSFIGPAAQIRSVNC
jgi:hypothetical protein